MLTRSKRETKGNEISIIANLKRIITFDRRREKEGGGGRWDNRDVSIPKQEQSDEPGSPPSFA